MRKVARLDRYQAKFVAEKHLACLVNLLWYSRNKNVFIRCIGRFTTITVSPAILTQKPVERLYQWRINHLN